MIVFKNTTKDINLKEKKYLKETITNEKQISNYFGSIII